MRCHWAYDEEGNKHLIPGCYGSIYHNSPGECTCSQLSYKSFEKKEYNDHIQLLKREIEDRDSLIENLQREIERLNHPPLL